MTSPRLLHQLPDAAEQLGVSQRVLERLIVAGDVKSVKIGRRRLVPHDALEEYVAKLKDAS